jgi:hypothetical protein
MSKHWRAGLVLLTTLLTFNSACLSTEKKSLSTNLNSGSLSQPTVQPIAPPVLSYTPNRFVTANASGNGDGSAASPWTLAQAMQSAQPGDVVQVGPGIYAGTYKPNWQEPTFLPARSGLQNSKIVFFAQYPAANYYQNTSLVSDVRNNGTYTQNAGAASTGSAAIGCFSRNYIVWDGFYVDEIYVAWAGDGGPVADRNSVGCEFRRNFIKMREQLTPLENGVPARTNHRGIASEDSDGVKILDNIIEGEGYRTNDPNRVYNGESGILMYDTKNYEIAHNILRNMKHAFYPKGVHDGEFPLVPGSFHHNLIEGCENAHEFNGIAATSTVAAQNEFLDIFQNIYINNLKIFNIRPPSTTDGPQQWRFVNNTVYNSQNGHGIAGFNANSTTAGELTMYRNNIFVGIATAWEIYQGDYASSYGKSDIAYNRYFTVNTFYNIGNLNLSAWKNLGADAFSSEGDPLFISANNRDFRLQSGSSVLRTGVNRGIDILNLQGEGTSASINLGAIISSNQSEVVGIR